MSHLLKTKKFIKFLKSKSIKKSNLMKNVPAKLSFSSLPLASHCKSSPLWPQRKLNEFDCKDEDQGSTLVPNPYVFGSSLSLVDLLECNDLNTNFRCYPDEQKPVCHQKGVLTISQVYDLFLALCSIFIAYLYKVFGYEFKFYQNLFWTAYYFLAFVFSSPDLLLFFIKMLLNFLSKKTCSYVEQNPQEFIVFIIVFILTLIFLFF